MFWTLATVGAATSTILSASSAKLARLTVSGVYRPERSSHYEVNAEEIKGAVSGSSSVTKKLLEPVK